MGRGLINQTQSKKQNEKVKSEIFYQKSYIYSAKVKQNDNENF